MKKLKLSEEQQTKAQEIIGSYDQKLDAVWKQFSVKYMATIRTECLLLAAVEDGLADHVLTEYCLQFRHKSVSPEYLKNHLSFDEATGLLVVVENFGWTEDESSRVVEHYAYREIDQAAELSDSDFDEKNSEYEFVAR